MKYSKEFERDWKWYNDVSDVFTFDGRKEYFNRKTGANLIRYNPEGRLAKEVFYIWDSQGRIVSCKEPYLLWKILKTKGSVNLHIKMYAEDLAKCNWDKIEMRALCIKLKAPDWVREAIVNQCNKLRIYE